MTKSRASRVIQDIIDCVCYHTKITYDEICGPSREEGPVMARAILVGNLRAQGMTWTRIGHIINRDHSDAIYLNKAYMNIKYRKLDGLICLDCDREVKIIVNKAWEEVK